MNKLTLSIAILLASAVASANTLRPKTVADMKTTSVRIMNEEQNSGGTGSIIRSDDSGSTILTNKHVCRLVEQGGVVERSGKIYQVAQYKKFPNHDLCLIKITANLGVNLKVSETLAPESSRSIVSGHPSLLPHIVTVGHLSEKMDIQLVAGIKPCTNKDLADSPEECFFFGGKPVMVDLEAQLVSNLIKPGNSGSAVFNADGELIGVVFAGSGRDFSYGLIVPQTFLSFFIKSANLFPFVKVGTPVDDDGFSDRDFNFDKCRDVTSISKHTTKIKSFCQSVNDTMIWRK